MVKAEEPDASSSRWPWGGQLAGPAAVRELAAGLCRVFSSRGATTPRPLRVLFDLLRKPAEFIGNIGGTEGQIAQTIGGLAQED